MYTVGDVVDAQFAYDAVGRLASSTRAGGGVTSTVSTFGFDYADRLVSLAHALTTCAITYGFGYLATPYIRPLTRPPSCRRAASHPAPEPQAPYVGASPANVSSTAASSLSASSGGASPARQARRGSDSPLARRS